MNKYIGKYRVFSPIDYRTGKTSANEDDTYLKANKYKIEVYREDDTTLAIYFPSGLSATNIILPLLDKMNIEYKLHIDCDIEKVYLTDEKYIDELHSILHFQTKGAKIKPSSKRTARRQNKQDT